MVEGTPGAPFEDEVVVRRRRWASEDSGFAVLDADRDGDEIVLVGPAGAPGGARACPRGRRLAGRPPLRAAGQGVGGRAARAGRRRRAADLPAARAATSGSTRAARLLERYGDDVLEAIDRDPHAAFRRLGLSPKRTGEAVKSWQRTALHARAAPAARAARARLAGAADHRPLRRARPRRRAPPPVRADQRVRGRLRHRGHDRPRGRARRHRGPGARPAWCTCSARRSATAPPVCRCRSWP